MPDSIPQTAFAALLKSNTPLLDVRAPIEYSRGSFPNATNIALLNDNAREQVGTTYKQQGADAALELGHKLIHAEVKADLLRQWQLHLEAYPSTVLYCYRGGQRSNIVQQWLAAAGYDVPLIEGGFKALRRFLIDTLEKISLTDSFIIAGGKTGSGKTHLINGLNASVDLEGRANHRGSAFGRRITAQPAQIDFENSLAIDFIKLPSDSLNRIFIEDESHSIGSIHLPPNFYAAMKVSPLAIIEASVSSRTAVIFNDYIHSNYLDFVAVHGEEGLQLFSESLMANLDKIRRRLGDDLYSQIRDIMRSALRAQSASGDSSEHKDWIKLLLINYYDPMYDYQLAKKSDRIVFRGNPDEFVSWANSINPEVR
ncbi:MAG: tRNA 2-selenouridine synthase [Glaciecola sp.]|jgi:tRNA 2-selenouridine synthase